MGRFLFISNVLSMERVISVGLSLLELLPSSGSHAGYGKKSCGLVLGGDFLDPLYECAI